MTMYDELLKLVTLTAELRVRDPQYRDAALLLIGRGARLLAVLWEVGAEELAATAYYDGGRLAARGATS